MPWIEMLVGGAASAAAAFGQIAEDFHQTDGYLCQKV